MFRNTQAIFIACNSHLCFLIKIHQVILIIKKVNRHFKVCYFEQKLQILNLLNQLNFSGMSGCLGTMSGSRSWSRKDLQRDLKPRHSRDRDKNLLDSPVTKIPRDNKSLFVYVWTRGTVEFSFRG